MAGCGEHEDMQPGAFLTHVKEKAKKIKEIAAKLGADKVFMMADGQQRWVSLEAVRRGGGRMEDAVPIPADKGYSWLPEDSRAVVDEWRNKYNVDLLSFDATDRDDAESQLRDVHLTWIETQFDRAGEIPYPKNAEPHINALCEIAGEGELVEVSGTDDKPNFDKNVSAGEALLGNGIFNKVSVIQDQTSGWEAATATAFKNDFLPGIPTSVANQSIAAKTIRNMLAAHQGMLTGTRRNLDNIAHDGLTSAESFDECCPGGDDTKTILGIVGGILTITGGVVSIVGGIVATPVGGAAIAAGGIAVVSGGVTILANATSMPPDPDNTIGGDSIEDVIYNIKDKVSKTYSNLDEAYGKLKSDAMGKVAGQLVEGRALYFSAPRPDEFADSTRENVRENTE